MRTTAGALILGVLVGCGNGGGATVTTQTAEVTAVLAESTTSAAANVLEPTTSVGHATATADDVGMVNLRPVAQCFPTADPLEPHGPEFEDVLPVRGTDESCLVGPVGGTAEIFVAGSAAPTFESQHRWAVSVDLRTEGEQVWNSLASECFNGSSSCPSRQLAIVLDDVIQSAPVVNAPSFARAVSITGNFTEDEARALAGALNQGGLPANDD